MTDKEWKELLKGIVNGKSIPHRSICAEMVFGIIKEQIDIKDAQLRFAAGYISTTGTFTDKHPQEALDWIIEQTGKIE